MTHSCFIEASKIRLLASIAPGGRTHPSVRPAVQAVLDDIAACVSQTAVIVTVVLYDTGDTGDLTGCGKAAKFAELPLL